MHRDVLKMHYSKIVVDKLAREGAKASKLSFRKYVLNYVQPKPIIKQPQTRHFIFVFLDAE